MQNPAISPMVKTAADTLMLMGSLRLHETLAEQIEDPAELIEAVYQGKLVIITTPDHCYLWPAARIMRPADRDAVS